MTIFVQGLRFAGVAISPFLVLIYQRWLKLNNNVIIILNLFAIVTAYTVIGFAETNYVVFIGKEIYDRFIPSSVSEKLTLKITNLAKSDILSNARFHLFC